MLDVARWIRDELASIGAAGVPKTSGADGVHVYIPLPPGTPYEAGLLFCQIIATVVANKHPREATIERIAQGARQARLRRFPAELAGKTLASAYSARASERCGRVHAARRGKKWTRGVRARISPSRPFRPGSPRSATCGPC